MPSLDVILNAVSIPLEVGDLKFRLVGMKSRMILAWNRLQVDGETPEGTAAILDHIELRTDKQYALLADYMRDCLVSGDPKKVTAEWLQETFPDGIVQDIIFWSIEKRRPEWAGAEGK